MTGRPDTAEHEYGTIPYEAGWRAGERGDDPRSCPYDKMTAEYNEWQRGLTYAVNMARALRGED